MSSSIQLNLEKLSNTAIRNFIKSSVKVSYMRIGVLVYDQFRGMMGLLIKKHYGKGKIKTAPKKLIKESTFAKVVDGNGLSLAQIRVLQSRVEKDLQLLMALTFSLTRFAHRKTMYPKNMHAVRRIRPNNFVYS